MDLINELDPAQKGYIDLDAFKLRVDIKIQEPKLHLLLVSKVQ